MDNMAAQSPKSMVKMDSKDRLDVLDLIIDVLMTHEAKMDALSQRMEGLCRRLEAITRYENSETSQEDLDRAIRRRLEIKKEGLLNRSR
ncbi:MAG: hypothetical protein PVH79_00925 [Candidatus Bathyarchaeota archaeon]|jgi:hypothetical protein